MIEPYTLDFTNHGLVLIKGENGAGKTTGFSALFWVLYGETLKNKSTVNTWEHLRPKNYLGTKVSLTFNRKGKNLQVIRCQEYKGDIVPGIKGANRLMVLDEHGKELFQNKSKPELQKKLTQLIGLSPDLFKSSIIFGQKMKRLVDEDGPTKKKIFEEAFGVDYINLAKDIAYKKFKALESELIPMDRALFGKQSARETQVENIEKIKERMANHETTKATQLDNLKSQLKAIKKSLEDCTMGKEEFLIQDKSLSELKNKLVKSKLAFDKSKYTQLSTQVTKDEYKIKEYEKAILEYQKNLAGLSETGLCPFCGAKVKPKELANHQEEITSKITQYDIALQEVKKASNGHKKELASLIKRLNNIELTENKIDRLASDISKLYNYHPEKEKALQTQIKNKRGEIASLRKSVINFGLEDAIGELSRLESETKVLDKQVKGLRRKYQVQEWLYSKALSNSGLKAFIFNQMLNSLNIILENYAKQFGIRPYFMVDMASARKDIVSFAYINGAPVSFADLSGGQAQLANIITAFAAHDLIAKGRFNIMVLDEVFESLSATNVEIVTELISSKALNQQVFLITHNKDFKPTGARTLEFTLQDGVTRPLL
jgi:DNA repair exonuclease SbcCD ATPase subunit